MSESEAGLTPEMTEFVQRQRSRIDSLPPGFPPIVTHASWLAVVDTLCAQLSTTEAALAESRGEVERLTQAVCQANMTFNHLTNLSDEDRLFIEGFKNMCVAAEVQYTQPPQQISVLDEVIPDDDYSRGW